MKPQSVFRAQALSAARSQTLGGIVLMRPVSFTVLTSVALAVASATVALLLFGSYTERSTVAGQLVADAGLIKVVTPQSGVVTERHVLEGQSVKAGDALFVVSSERVSALQGDTQAAISAQVREREASLKTQLESTRRLHASERQGLIVKIAGLEAQLEELSSQLSSQRERITLAEASLARYQKLKGRDLVSNEQIGQKSGELLDQRSIMEALEREELSLRSSVLVERTNLTNLPLKQQNEIAELSRLLTSASQELVESEAKRRLVLESPADGTATAVLANVGQAVDPAKPLASIVPAGSALHAELYAPSSAVGFVKVGDPVLIRYPAFPYQKFGPQHGIVDSVARTALPSSELTVIGMGGAIAANATEPLYRITVRLASQSVLAYGQTQALQSGMTLEADVLRETRRLYEWVLEPLYSLKGKL
jgi:membrane fusion protein